MTDEEETPLCWSTIVIFVVWFGGVVAAVVVIADWVTEIK